MNNRHILGAMIAFVPIAVLAQAGSPPPVGNSMQTGAPSITAPSDPAANPAVTPSGDMTTGTDTAPTEPKGDINANVATETGDDAPPPQQ